MKRNEPTIGNIGDLRVARPLQGEHAFEAELKETTPKETRVQPKPQEAADSAPAAVSKRAGLLGLSGRLTRMRFIVRMGASLTLPTVALAYNLDPLHERLDAEPATVLGALASLGAAVLLYQCGIAASRARDLGRSGWFGLTLAVPGVNVLALFALALVPGHRSHNRYGPPNPRNGLLVWLAYVLFVLIPLGLAPAAVLHYDIYLQSRHANIPINS